MYNAQTVIERTQIRIKELGLIQKEVLCECGLSENALKQMTDKKGIGSFSLAKIADILNCSVDYLLGRTDEISVNSGNSINTGDITGNNNANMNIGTDKSETDELIELFNSLSLVQKAEIILKINEMKSGK